MRALLWSAIAWLLVTQLVAQSPPQSLPTDRRNFVACPILRDTKTNPCWLAQYKGETYFLGSLGGVSDNFHPPQLEHEVLVEGTVAPGPRVCGGIRLNPVKLSVLGEIAPACNAVLPAEDGIDAPAPQPRGKPDSWVKTDEPGSLTIFFEFGDDFMSVPAGNALKDLVKYFNSSGATRVEVESFRGATLLSDGNVLTEHALLAQERLAKVLVILKGLGLPERVINARTSEAVPKPDGVNDQRSRRVVLKVQQ
jgi:hypothetical protein